MIDDGGCAGRPPYHSLVACRACPRLAAHLAELRRQLPDHHNLPVPAWGRADAHLLIVGLAPGLHGANRTGRPFTGDASGHFLFVALHRAGFATQPAAAAARLLDARITNAVRCLPPRNRPLAPELRRCSGYLREELRQLWRPGVRRPRVVLALGRLAHEAVSLAWGEPLPPFRHGADLELAPRLLLLDTYHPSRQNTNTGRLTAAMLDAVLERARARLYSERP